jgi:hypothetical protein
MAPGFETGIFQIRNGGHKSESDRCLWLATQLPTRRVASLGFHRAEVGSLAECKPVRVYLTVLQGGAGRTDIGL